MAQFTARLLPTEGGTYVEIPPSVVEALKVTGRTSVAGTIDGHPFQHQFMPYFFEGEGRKVVMAVNKATRAMLVKHVGDSVDLDLERDDRPRSPKVSLAPKG